MEHPKEVARQEYELARKEYQDTCERFDALSEEAVGRFHAALERKNLAHDRYMEAIMSDE
jgi:hypothetical protein